MNNNLELLKRSYQIFFDNINKQIILTNNDNKKKINFCEYNNYLQFNNTNNKYYKYFIEWYNNNKKYLHNDIINIIDVKDKNKILSSNDNLLNKNIIFSLIYKILITKFNITVYYIDHNKLFILDE